MKADPFLGVIFHWIGGLAAASFYIPYRGVKNWAWETYWLAGGVFSWIIAPWVLAYLLVPDLLHILGQSPERSIFWTYLFGMVWGVGGLTFGLTMRYLGIALGMAVALGYCAAFGTLMPPIFNGEFGQILQERSGQVILLGVLVCLAGIAVSGYAGMSKEQELTDAQKKSAVKEFSFGKGIVMATISGLLSASFAYGLAAGKPIAALTKTALAQHSDMDIWQNLPVLIVILLGGFVTNAIWCLWLNFKNKTATQYFQGKAGDGLNYLFCAIAGVTWYLQFFFYSIGQTKMGKYDFSSWTLHMASIIIFSTLWGVALREWKGTSRKTHLWIGVGLVMLIASTVIVGYGTSLKASALSDGNGTIETRKAS